MKIVIAGAGEVGSYLAKMLSNGSNQITVIDNILIERLKLLSSKIDILTLESNPVSLTVLREANIGKTDLFIAVTPYETTNIVATILAKQLGAKKTVARIDNMEYIINMKFFEQLGIDSLFYPEELAAREIAKALKQHGANKVFEFSGGKLSLFAIKLEANAPIVNKTLQEVSSINDSYDFRAVAITRYNETIIPTGTDQFKVNDTVYIISNQTGVDDVMRFTGKKPYSIKSVIILGGSRIGIKTALSVENQLNVKLIEISKDKCYQIAGVVNNTLVINGDGRDIDLLTREGIGEIDAFVALTGNSDTNILACLTAKQLGVKKTIAEVENMDYITMAQNLGIETVINKKLIVAGNIYRHTTGAEVSSVLCLAGTEAEILEFVVHKNSRVTKDIIRNVNFPKGAIIGGIIRGKSNIIAKGDSLIQPSDKVVVFALPTAIDKVVRYFN